MIYVMIALILERNPAATGVRFDARQAAATTHELIDRYVEEGPAEIIRGDFFDSVPPNRDAYVLKAILHDWDDDSAVAILRNCRSAMGPSGLVADTVISADNVPSAQAFIDLTMLLYVHGGERTEAEFRELFHRAGLELAEITHIQPTLTLLQAVPR
jgi:O-methyltransferase domain